MASFTKRRRTGASSSSTSSSSDYYASGAGRGGAGQHPTVTVQIGNTYQALPEYEAPRSRCGKFAKVHDWTLYCDVVDGPPDLIHRVSFKLHPTFAPATFSRTLPPFQSRQQSYGLFTASVKIELANGKSHVFEYPIQDRDARQREHTMVVRGPLDGEIRAQRMPDRTFGVELELTIEGSVALGAVASEISRRAGGERCVRADYGAATSTAWKIQPDSSIQCGRSMPDCNRFELVSPVLNGGRGLTRLNNVMRALQSMRSPSSACPAVIKVNKSMGTHVHVGTHGLDLHDLKKIGVNFCKYERAMDSIMPGSRKRNNNDYCKSVRNNTTFAGGVWGEVSNVERTDMIMQCQSTSGLAALLNPRRGAVKPRYYKLNLQNLATGRQETLEFRQHSATFNYRKIAAWVRFVVNFVENSAKFRVPRSLKEGTPLDKEFDGLFSYVVKDRYLRDFYRNRQIELAAAAGGGAGAGAGGAGAASAPCCDGCAGEGVCQSGF